MATRDDVISKIQKLLKLAESSNVNEAATAAAMAQDLMNRFEIEAAAIQGETPTAEVNEPVETFGDFENGGRIENWRGMLLTVLCGTNACMAYKTRAFSESGKAESVLKVIGRKTDAQTVRYMYQALASLVEGLASTQRVPLP